MSRPDTDFNGYLRTVLRDYAELERALRTRGGDLVEVTERERNALCDGAAARLHLDEETAQRFAVRLRREWHEVNTIEMRQALREQQGSREPGAD